MPLCTSQSVPYILATVQWLIALHSWVKTLHHWASQYPTSQGPTSLGLLSSLHPWGFSVLYILGPSQCTTSLGPLSALHPWSISVPYILDASQCPTCLQPLSALHPWGLSVPYILVPYILDESQCPTSSVHISALHHWCLLEHDLDNICGWYFHYDISDFYLESWDLLNMSRFHKLFEWFPMDSTIESDQIRVDDSQQVSQVCWVDLLKTWITAHFMVCHLLDIIQGSVVFICFAQQHVNLVVLIGSIYEHVIQQNSMYSIHTWRTIVFIQPGMQEVSIIICASKVSEDQYWPWPRQCYL